MASDVRMKLPLGHKTRRTKAVEAVAAEIAMGQFRIDIPEGPDNPKLFDSVGYGTLDDISVRETPACRIQEGEEEVIPGMNMKTTKSLRIYVHFKIVNVVGVDQTDLINYYFGRIVRVLVNHEDFEAHGIMDVTEAGNAVISNGASDPEPGGTIWFDLEYRHTEGNYFAE